MIHAPENGIVTKVEQLQVGDYVNASTPVFSLMSTEHVWVEANFKEDRAHPHAAGPGGDGRGRHLSRRRLSRQGREPQPRHRARPSRCCRRRTRPAIGSRSCSACRCASASTQLDPNAPLHAGLSATVEVDTRYRRPWLDRRPAACSPGCRRRADEPRRDDAMQTRAPVAATAARSRSRSCWRPSCRASTTRSPMSRCRTSRAACRRRRTRSPGC